MLHSKKIKEEYFKKVVEGYKPYEIRVNDCDYRVGDYLALNEINENGLYTGRFTVTKIIEIFEATEYIQENYVVLTLEPKNVVSSSLYQCITNWDRTARNILDSFANKEVRLNIKINDSNKIETLIGKLLPLNEKEEYSIDLYGFNGKRAFKPSDLISVESD